MSGPGKITIGTLSPGADPNAATPALPGRQHAPHTDDELMIIPEDDLSDAMKAALQQIPDDRRELIDPRVPRKPDSTHSVPWIQRDFVVLGNICVRRSDLNDEVLEEIREVHKIVKAEDTARAARTRSFSDQNPPEIAAPMLPPTPEPAQPRMEIPSRPPPPPAPAAPQQTAAPEKSGSYARLLVVAGGIMTLMALIVCAGGFALSTMPPHTENRAEDTLVKPPPPTPPETVHAAVDTKPPPEPTPPSPAFAVLKSYEIGGGQNCVVATLSGVDATKNGTEEITVCGVGVLTKDNVITVNAAELTPGSIVDEIRKQPGGEVQEIQLLGATVYCPTIPEQTACMRK